MIAIINDKENKKSQYILTMAIFAILMWIAASAVIAYDHRYTINLNGIINKQTKEIDEQTQKIEEQEQKIDKQTQKINQYGAMVGNDKFFKDFIVFQRMAINKISSQESGKFVDDLLNSLEQNKQGREKLSEASKKIAAKNLVKWQPVYDMIISQFDHRMESLRKKGYIIEIKKDDIEILVIERKRVNGEARKYH